VKTVGHKGAKRYVESPCSFTEDLMEFENRDKLIEIINIDLKKNKELNRKLMIALQGINRICKTVLKEVKLCSDCDEYV